MHKKMLNIGCGSNYHTEWINIDFNSNNQFVIKHDLRNGLPFEDNSFDVVYSSHVLEHLTKMEADTFILEQKRVLKIKGIIRVVVPDLEKICLNYIKYLYELLTGNIQNEFRYDYSLLELFDQAIRKESGGELGSLWANGEITDLDFILERHGVEVVNYIKSKVTNNKIVSEMSLEISNTSLYKKIFKKFTNSKKKVVELLISLLLGKVYVQYFREGIFRNEGEIHREMYDKYSLARLLTKHGFSNITITSAFESIIHNFQYFQLDVINSQIRKPDSLFMEAIVLK